MNIEEAITTALSYEKNITQVYQDYADKFKSEVGKKIFKTLGKEEEDHVAYLEAKLAQWNDSGKIQFDDIETVVPDRNTLEKNVQKIKDMAENQDKTAISEEIGYFEKALEMEIATSNFYKDMVSQLPAGHQPMFKRFVEIEEGHEAVVKAEIDTAKGMGFWFDFMEFDLESA